MLNELSVKLPSYPIELMEIIRRYIEEIEKKINSEKLNVIFLGINGSGKSSIINSILSETTRKIEKNRILPTCNSGGTFYTTVIESSDNTNFQVIIEKNTIIVEEKEFSSSNDVYLFIDDFNLKGSDNFNKIIIKERNSNNQVKALENDFLVIKIKVPNFLSNIRLIESPNLCSKTLKDHFFKLLNTHYIHSIFVFLRSMTQESVINEYEQSIWSKIKENYQNSLFFICLTKYDAYLKDILKGSFFYQPDTDSIILKEKTKDALHFDKNIRTFLEELDKKPIITTKTFLLKKPLGDINDYQGDRIQDLIDFVQSYQNENACIIKNLNVLISLRNKIPLALKEFYRKKVSDEEISKKFPILISFKQKLVDWKNKFPKNFKDFNYFYGPELVNIRKVFDLNDSILRKKYNVLFNRRNYIKEQFNHLSKDLTNIIEKEFGNLFILSTDGNNFDGPHYLYEKLKNPIFSQLEFIETKPHFLSKSINFFDILKLCFICIYPIISYKYLPESYKGWLLFGSISLLLFSNSISSYLSQFSSENCYLDFINSFYSNWINNMEAICDQYVTYMKEIFLDEYIKESSSSQEVSLFINDFIKDEKMFEKIKVIESFKNVKGLNLKLINGEKFKI